MSRAVIDSLVIHHPFELPAAALATRRPVLASGPQAGCMSAR